MVTGSHVIGVDATVVAGAFRVCTAFTATSGITAIVGPSGAGKSVTLAAVAGLLRPVDGTIVLDGRVVADAKSGAHVRTQDRAVGLVFQDGALLPHRSPLDNVALATPDRRAGRVAARDWLARVGAANLADATTAKLSGGERQRVALARALASAPRFLLLDEPFSALDRAARDELRRLVRGLVDELRLVTLLVTHDQADVDALADAVVTFEAGRTVG